MSKSPSEPPEPGVRLSIYLPADLAERVTNLAWEKRMSRSAFLADVIAKATKPKASGVRKGKTVPDVPDTTGD